MEESGKNGGDEHGRCLESLIEVFLYIDGQVGPRRAKEIELHLEHCAKCYGRVEFERILRDYVKRKAGNEPASRVITDRVKSFLSPA